MGYSNEWTLKKKGCRALKANNVVLVAVILAIGMIFATECAAKRLLTQEEALAEMFPDAESIVNNTHTMTADEVERVKARLGGQLVHYQKGSKSEMVEENLEYHFYYSVVNGEKTGVAIIESQPGKWGPVEFCIALDTKTAKIKNLAVMSYKEKRGRPIARNNFLKQFVGKGSEDPIKVRKDIRAISGATISSDCTCFAVRKAIVLYEELFFNNGVTETLSSEVSNTEAID
jgi:Na+-translocating ferredoxin:NAD+ oxidoreductase RnfG subunit